MAQGSGSGRTARNEAQKHASLLRAQQVVEIKLQNPNLGFRRIGERIGISHTAARRLWLKAMEHAQAELTEEAKLAVAVEVRKLDELWALNYERATNRRIDIAEQQAATDRCLRISAERRKLLGLDAPERHELAGAGGGPVLFQEVQALEGDALDDELAGYFNPGYMEGAADGYQRGLEDGRKETRGKKKPVKKAKPAEEKPTPKRRRAAPQQGGDGQARTGSTVVVAEPRQGRARV